jgi:hypothetical protein
VAIPLVTPTPLLFGVGHPEWVYPLVFVVTLIAVAVLGRKPRIYDDAPRSLRTFLGARS